MTRKLGATTFGDGYSDQRVVPRTGQEVRVLTVNRPLADNFGGCDGIASVHVGVRDTGDVFMVGRTNGMLQLTISWGAGRGGGDAVVDATQGTTFTVAATHALTIDAALVSAIEGLDLNAYVAKRVEVSVHWGTSFNPKPAYCSLPAVTLAAGVASSFYRIPKQARAMMLCSDDHARLAATTAEFSCDSTATSIIYETIDPNANGTPIGHGVEFVRFTSPQTQLVTPKFELYL